MIFYRCILYLITFFLLFSCQAKKKDSQQSPQIPRPVRVVKVEALGSTKHQYTGIVKANEFSVLAFKVSGTLTTLAVREGQIVRRGDLIARINAYDYQKQLQTAKANYTTAKAIYDRTQRLYDANATALQNLEINQADYIRATSAANIAQLTLDYTTLTAPFDGFIEQLYVKNYEEILSGQSIVRLVNPDNIEVDFTLPETNIGLLQVPKKIYVEFDTQKGQLFTTKVKEYIYSSQGTGIPVTLEITDEQFAPYRKYVFPGFSCKVTVEVDNMVSNNFIIPGSAIFQQDGQDYVWVIDPRNHTAQRQKVNILRFEDQAVVREGLNSEDLIVTAGVATIQEGQKVSLEKLN